MRKILAALIAAAVLITGCSVPTQKTDETTATQDVPPVLNPDGVSTVFGLEVSLAFSTWEVLESNRGTFDLQYNPGRGRCNGACSTLSFSTLSDASSLDSERYRHNVDSGGRFVVEADCSAGSLFDTAVEQDSPFNIGGERTRYFINPPCPNGATQRYSWHLAGRQLLIEYVQKPAGAKLADAGVEGILRNAVFP